MPVVYEGERLGGSRCEYLARAGHGDTAIHIHGTGLDEGILTQHKRGLDALCADGLVRHLLVTLGFDVVGGAVDAVGLVNGRIADLAGQVFVGFLDVGLVLALLLQVGLHLRVLFLQGLVLLIELVHLLHILLGDVLQTGELLLDTVVVGLRVDEVLDFGGIGHDDAVLLAQLVGEVAILGLDAFVLRQKRVKFTLKFVVVGLNLDILLVHHRLGEKSEIERREQEKPCQRTQEDYPFLQRICFLILILV